MGKIKLNLVSGSSVEKPLITAFKDNEMGYVILDNELNGSMGLPIILVCKLNQNKLIKIEDQNEWQNVKESLKKIIATGQAEYISLPNELIADDIYYTQLTLPVPSFDALKNSYNPGNTNSANLEQPIVNNNESTPVMANVNPVSENQPINTPVVDSTPIVGSTPVVDQTPVVNNPIEQSIPPVTPEPNPVEFNNAPINPTTDANSVNGTIPESPLINNGPVVNPTQIGNETMNIPNNVQPNIDLTAPIVNVEPIETPSTNDAITSPNVPDITPGTPVVPEAPNVINNVPNVEQVVTAPTPEVNPISNLDNPTNENANNGDRFKEQKEAFMMACENMFDALVQKFEKEMQNK